MTRDLTDESLASANYWVECSGGPHDGRMIELDRDRRGRPWPAFFVGGSHIHMPDGSIRRGGVQGHYFEDGWADEELGVVRMTWRPDPPDEWEDDKGPTDKPRRHD